MEDGINIFYPDGHNEVGRIHVSSTEIIIFKKSMFVMVLFGIIGNLLFKGKETLRLNISDIISGHKEKFRLNKNAYHITTKNGETYILCFDSPKKMIPYLESLIKNQ